MKTFGYIIALGITVLSLSSCCCDRGCGSCCEERCLEPRPHHCCPKPHFWDNSCCDPSNYAY